jgi:hypothetical protein
VQGAQPGIVSRIQGVDLHPERALGVSAARPPARRTRRISRQAAVVSVANWTASTDMIPSTLASSRPGAVIEPTWNLESRPSRRASWTAWRIASAEKIDPARPVRAPAAADVRLGVVAGRVLDRPPQADVGTPDHASSVTAKAPSAPVVDVTPTPIERQMLQDAARVLAARQELADLLQTLRGDLGDEEAAGRLRDWLDLTRPAAGAAQRRLAVALRASPELCPNDGPWYP